MERQKMEQQHAENLNMMAVNIHGNTEDANLSKDVHTSEIYEENGKRSFLRATDMKRAQDSGISSNQTLFASQGETSCVTFQNQSNHEKQISSYVTSTPKKETRILDGIIDYEILPSQMILDDPLLSSVDDAGDLTDHTNSPASNDECEDSFTSLYKTKMKSHYDNSKRYPLMSRFMNDISARQKIARSQSFSGTVQQHSLEPDPTFVRKNLFDIPVSPKLKSRVRQRLFTLVNSIDGYKGQVNIEEEEEENIRKFTFKRVHTLSKKIQGTQTESNLVFESNGNSCKSASVQDNFGNHIISEKNVNDTKDCKCHSQEFSKPNADDQQQHKSGLDQTYLSTLSKSISERYGSAISSMLESQMKTIQLHQEQLNQEKFSCAMQKKDQETHTRISFYQEKSQQMIQIMEELELKISELQKKLKEQDTDYQDKIKRQDERHKESLAMMRLECEKKVHEAEYKVMSVREEVTKSCDQKIIEILLTTKEKSTLLEKQHEAHVLQLNSVISKLRADKQELEISLANSNSDSSSSELVTSIAEICKEKDALKQEIEVMKQRLKGSCPADKKVVAQQEDTSDFEITERLLREEIEIWKKEAEELQKKLNATESEHKKFLDESRQNVNLQHQNSQPQKITREQKKNLSSKESLEKEVILLRAQLQQSQYVLLQEHRNFKSLLKKLAGELANNQEHHKQMMLSYQASLERERSSAISEAVACKQEETKVILTELKAHYENLLRNVQAHGRAQIDEYKKAVRFLKTKIKKMEEG